MDDHESQRDMIRALDTLEDEGVMAAFGQGLGHLSRLESRRVILDSPLPLHCRFFSLYHQSPFSLLSVVKPTNFGPSHILP